MAIKLSEKQQKALKRWDAILGEELAKKPDASIIAIHVRKAVIEIIQLLDEVGD